MRWVALAVVCSACAADVSTTQQAATVCGGSATVNGMDVAGPYDEVTDWAAAKASGIDFAFIRVSDGLQYPDPWFDDYWPAAKAAGMLRGAYQFFRPDQDPIAQADFLLGKILPVTPGDLPPVLDLENAGDLTHEQVVASVQAWVDHVSAAIGRPPIVYAGLYSWPELTGGADYTTSPLWIAQYTSAACPNIPDPWTSWLFWQHTASGSAPGVTGTALDLDVFDGTLADLQAFATAAPPPCGTIPADGGEIDDGDPCFVGGGPSASMRHVSDAGNDGDLVWTHTTEDTEEANFGQWNLDFAAAGHYQIEVYTAAAYAQSKQADYLVHTADGDTSVTIDQTAADGWQTLGTFAFAAGADQYVHLGDNTGEPLANNVQLVFDAVRVTPADYSGPGSDQTQPGGDDGDPTMMKSGGGCDGGGGGASWAVLMVASCAAFRRRSGSRRR
jgi:lysozyme